MVTVLQTERLLLRQFEPGDGEQLHAITGDPDVMRFVGDLKPFSPGQTRTMIEAAIAHYEQRGFGEYAITCKATGELIGYGGFAILPERACPEIDYIFRRDQWGRGLASELAPELVRYAFGELGFDVLGASFDPRNHASMRVAAKAGFQFARTGLDEHGLPTVYYERRRPGQPLRFTLLDAASPLGVGPTGVEHLAEALRAAGLGEALNAENGGVVPVPPHDPRRDPGTLLLNPVAIRDYSRRLADAVGDLLHRGRFPVVLGGDCNILIGDMLALRRRGRYGLFFLDGHADFYQPEASPTGAVSDMDLAIVTGHGPPVLSDIEGRHPLVGTQDVVVFGYRDAEEAVRYGSRDVRDAGMEVYDLAAVRRLGAEKAAALALDHLLGPAAVAGFWIHLDADVLDDAVMPAVDYRLPGGLSLAELSAVLRTLVHSGKAVGLEITVFNPALDPDGLIARRFVRSIADGLARVGG